jgi:hypothetical protein
VSRPRNPHAVWKRYLTRDERIEVHGIDKTLAFIEEQRRKMVERRATICRRCVTRRQAERKKSHDHVV